MVKNDDRVTLDLKSYELSATWKTPYGNCFLYKFIDKNNKTYIWKSQKQISQNFIHSVTGRISGEMHYLGKKETMLTYCKIT